MSVLFISSELEEVVRACDRVSVLRDRQMIAELEGNESANKPLCKPSRAAQMTPEPVKPERWRLNLLWPVAGLALLLSST